MCGLYAFWAGRILDCYQRARRSHAKVSGFLEKLGRPEELKAGGSRESAARCGITWKMSELGVERYPPGYW